jgi:hypothetical protein
MPLERPKLVAPTRDADPAPDLAALVSTEVSAITPRDDHGRDLARTLVDNFGDTTAIEFLDDERLERIFRAILQHRRLAAADEA